MQNQSTALAAAGRLLIAVLFLVGGVGKIAAPAATQGYIASVGLPAPLFGYLIAIIIEVGGGSLLLVGDHTRLDALVLCAFTLRTARAFHNNFSDQNQIIQFMKKLASTEGLLHVAAF